MQNNSNQPRFYDIVPKTQYNFDGGKSACTAISLCVIRACLLKQHKTQDDFEITDIDFCQAMEVGSSCWKIWWDKCGKAQNKSFIFVYELYKLPEAKAFRRRLDLVEEYYGKLRGGSFEAFPHFDTLESSVKILFQSGDNHYAVVTIRYRSFTLIVKNNKIWLFASHGSPKNPKHSALICFNSE
jgi:hypothetical protein